MSEWQQVEAEDRDRALFYEFAVYDKTKKRIQGFGRWASYPTEEEAREYLVWLKERREEMRVKAEENEASGFEGGNGDWWVYNKEGWKDADWIVVNRTFSAWAPVEDRSSTQPISASNPETTSSSSSTDE